MDDATLIQRIKATALLRGTFTLRSGRISHYYLDKYLFETQPDILAALGQRLAACVPPDTDRVVLVEDIATTGGQVLEAAKALREAGAEVLKIVAVIDRQEGARENIEGAGFAFGALMTKTDLGIDE